MKDKEILKVFVDMLKRNGVEVGESYDEGLEYTIKNNNTRGLNKDTLTFCLDDEGNFNRIMGFTGDYFSDEIFKK